MPLIAVTGGIGAGKSEFTRLLAAASGAESIDTDQCARELLEGDSAVAAEIRTAFGDQVFDSEGKISRPALREAVFAEREKRRTLEAILHPRIRQRWTAWAAERRGAGTILLVEIPLLYETGAAGLFDCTVAVGCSRETQLRRLVDTRALSLAAAQRIIDSQLPVTEKIRQCDILIWNDGSRAALESQVALCADRLSLLARFRSPAPHD